MHPRKSPRHVKAARARWRAADARAQAERDAGIPDDPLPTDAREPFTMRLSAFGWRDVRIEPRIGYVSWRCLDEQSGELLHCAASKELMRWIAGQLPRMLAMRNWH